MGTPNTTPDPRERHTSSAQRHGHRSSPSAWSLVIRGLVALLTLALTLIMSGPAQATCPSSETIVDELTCSSIVTSIATTGRQA